jgi:transposase
MPEGAALLFADSTLLRWFPPLRSAWALRGGQAKVAITGQNAKRALFGAIDVRTGARLSLRRPRQGQEDFQAFLRQMRRRYYRRGVWLLLDRASCHEAAKSQDLAEQLGISLVWLPKQCPELHPVDHLWKEAKRTVAANLQYENIDDEARRAQRWLMGLSPREALRKAGILSQNFWLKAFL